MFEEQENHLELSPELRQIGISAHLEQSPNPNSRVMLGDELDQFGQRRLVLKWRLSELDHYSANQSIDMLAAAFGVANLGRLRTNLNENDHVWSTPESAANIDTPQGSFHHLGTTRMHESPQKGVVDSNLKVHGMDNLYIAGSSVFPTGGFANPTLTIVALCCKLADHLVR